MKLICCLVNLKEANIIADVIIFPFGRLIFLCGAIKLGSGRGAARRGGPQRGRGAQCRYRPTTLPAAWLSFRTRVAKTARAVLRLRHTLDR